MDENRGESRDSEVPSAQRRKATTSLIWRYVIWIVLIAAALAVVGPNFIKIKDEPPGPRAKQDLCSIQLALERYAVDNGGFYPLDIHQLAVQGYMPKFPKNEYTHKYGPDAVQMQPIAYGSRGHEGDFVYLKVSATINGFEHAVGYQLYLYGKEGESHSRGFTPFPSGIDSRRVTFMLDNVGYQLARQHKPSY